MHIAQVILILLELVHLLNEAAFTKHKWSLHSFNVAKVTLCHFKRTYLVENPNSGGDIRCTQQLKPTAQLQAIALEGGHYLRGFYTRLEFADAHLPNDFLYDLGSPVVQYNH